MLEEMIRKFRDAEGRSEFVIAVVCDIRNFSGFSVGRQAPEIAMFIRKFYEKLLSVYFTDAVFAKPTGDGLLMAFRYKYDQADLLAVSESVLKQCQRAIKDYPTMFTDDLMINYTLPERIGFGVARGTAFCLFAGEEVIDYSGQVFNLASRLNDLAKPSGIVIDGAFLLNVIPKNMQGAFRTEEVYIRGIAEDVPHEIFCSEDVVITEAAKTPINSHTWEKSERIIPYGQVKKVSGVYSIQLPAEPMAKSKCKLKLSWMSLINPGHITSMEVTEFSLIKDAEGIRITFDLARERERLVEEKLKSDSEVTISVHYVPKASPPKEPKAPA
jgi:class 3 adenylate cyclase